MKIGSRLLSPGSVLRGNNMKITKRRIFSALAGLLACGTLAACADFPAWLRRHTYPPDFNYITQEQLRSTMWQLAKQVRELQLLMHEPASIDERRRGEIIKLLAAMERATGELKAQGRPSNHPLIDANLGPLRRDITLAREAVEKTPPNYFLVGSLTGACVYCHSGSG